jgi:hypothetical protein
MTSAIALIVLTAVIVFGWSLRTARRKREADRAVTMRWLSEHAYEREGDDRTR